MIPLRCAGGERRLGFSARPPIRAIRRRSTRPRGLTCGGSRTAGPTNIGTAPQSIRLRLRKPTNRLPPPVRGWLGFSACPWLRANGARKFKPRAAPPAFRSCALRWNVLLFSIDAFYGFVLFRPGSLSTHSKKSFAAARCKSLIPLGTLSHSTRSAENGDKPIRVACGAEAISAIIFKHVIMVRRKNLCLLLIGCSWGRSLIATSSVATIEHTRFEIRSSSKVLEKGL